MMDHFYDPHFSSENPVLNQSESHHCLKVLRHRIGSSIRIMDGSGTIWEGDILSVNSENCLEIKISDREDIPSPSNRVVIAIAPPKSSDRIEWFVEKSVEVGVSEIYFFHSDRSERRKINLERLEKKVISAMKQSHNPWRPQIHPIITFGDLLQKDISYDDLFIADISGSDNMISGVSDKLIIIGPEGGLTSEEIQMAYDIGGQSISLGDNILRTETAGIVALALARQGK